jgi:hypothetical protein
MKHLRAEISVGINVEMSANTETEILAETDTDTDNFSSLPALYYYCNLILSQSCLM